MHPQVVLDSLAVRWTAWLADVMMSALLWGVGIVALVFVLLMVIEWVSAPRE